RPKCLVEIGGKSLLVRLIEGLAAAGVRDAVVVTGFGAEAVRAAVGHEVGGVRIRVVVNPRFREGAILSLWAARDWLSGPVLVMDADVLCPPAMLDRLVRSPQPNCFLLDAGVESTGEEQMLLTTDGLVRDIVRGGAPGYELAGESVGFLKLSAEGARLLRDLLAERVTLAGAAPPADPRIRVPLGTAPAVSAPADGTLRLVVGPGAVIDAALVRDVEARARPGEVLELEHDGARVRVAPGVLVAAN